MKFLKEHCPVLLSPKFWGLSLYTVLSYLQAKGWIGGIEVEHLARLVGLATGVGVADSLFRKIGKSK
jgi:hypothetical protein